MDELKKKETLDYLNRLAKGNLSEVLEITFTEVEVGMLKAIMPVTPKHHQPFGLLHGGASCVLAETLGSCLSLINIDLNTHFPVGITLSTNHLRAIKKGLLTGTARFIRKGQTVHFSKIEIMDEQGHLINYTTMTNQIIPNPQSR